MTADRFTDLRPQVFHPFPASWLHVRFSGFRETKFYVTKAQSECTPPAPRHFAVQYHHTPQKSWCSLENKVRRMCSYLLQTARRDPAQLDLSIDFFNSMCLLFSFSMWHADWRNVNILLRHSCVMSSVAKTKQGHAAAKVEGCDIDTKWMCSGVNSKALIYSCLELRGRRFPNAMQYIYICTNIWSLRWWNAWKSCGQCMKLANISWNLQMFRHFSKTLKGKSSPLC